MPTAIALRSFDHNGKVSKGDTVTFDAVTMKALHRSGLVGKFDEGESEPVKTDAPVEPVPTPGSLAKPAKPAKGGGKSAVSPAVPASPPQTSNLPAAGDLPPPLPVQ